ncbi:MAG: undecaprenyldiphospho-muramoylpentapeptide beta-N-acetylglucosaminyltransferase [Emergencia sp.]|jgi:UDP-N-acetylglucosamine--N-acetylmuramyl-(pentapeptide) pyrophosphoryl-undecaprenol N-acetylglucosamine transferase|uniref:UDP-N-acetylglucosamine--N-acetylmuramyl-(pentapeptide) pyrophosphoryl-undecaprenol N-acetylglucosamine transferase n=1 Tax=Anaerotruncus colihominis TaxID=169435 RepID=A0A845QHK4_9FIRM|nr:MULTISPECIES: undecaprenyldiphospho-muramoylpentapeptide beta-N-acetylglucosaminyltransferase [Anaerotruncus]MCI9475149.1 undecaprenyldiphospho-muramoylpentapeptide beta-N-acetylglucosaminyltransferase [Emergencia sp.]NBH60213.1 undecaprenyldiphospho-muramoylpentapeptide beta-N-acetylglucosaminyltransferase [Anaerotruncus colihominis]NCF00867.1 undecaprenyldiphospho-muramoylpentapeptide beta-N-acetylglucosaminyltransferase [Anaerotruncus sp. 80]
MRVIVTGGGSGGHIYPAIAIADKIKEKEPDSEILYIGNDIGLEKDIVPGTGYPMELVSAKWLDRRNIFKIFDTGLSTMRGIGQALRIMKKFKPDAVVGTGGFVCVPVMYAAHKYGAKCYLHEQNAYPGVANKTLEKFADKIFLGFPEASHYFHQPEKHVNVGNPVRQRFYDVDQRAAREKLDIGSNDFVIFSFGGSQGAEKINEVAFDLMEAVNGHKGVTFIFGTGSQYYDEILKKAEEKKIEIQPNIRVKSYINDMETYLGASDLIISRAGALSVAETTVCGKASILIPSPNVTGNHQFFNAKSVADKGGAVLIEEKNLTSELLLSEVMRLRNNLTTLTEMSNASKACAPLEATELIYAEMKKDERV